MIKLLNILKENNNIFYRLESKDQLKQGKIEKLKVEVATNLSELAIITYSWYGDDLDNFQLFKLKGIIKSIEKHTYQLYKNKQVILFCNQNNIDWEPDIEEEYIIANIDVPTIEITEQIPIDNNILFKIYDDIG
jgi:hypothetical protein